MNVVTDFIKIYTYLYVGFFTHLKYFTKYYFSLQCDPFTTVTFKLYVILRILNFSLICALFTFALLIN